MNNIACPRAALPLLAAVVLRRRVRRADDRALPVSLGSCGAPLPAAADTLWPSVPALMTTTAVEDRGCDIDESWKQNVRVPFVDTKGKGRGLGMLDVKKRVEAVHGGVVDIDSEVGRGPRVEPLLPRKQPKETRSVRRRNG